MSHWNQLAMVRRWRRAAATTSGCIVLAACLAAAGREAEPEIPFARTSERVRQLVQQMTLAEKVGQMTQADQQFLKHPSDVERLFLGSLLSGGDSDPADGNSREAWARMVLGWQRRSLKTRLRIPLLYGVDAVHGHNNVLGAVIFPHHIGLGCTGNPQLVQEVARMTAREVRATGIQWTFAPCVTVPRDERWGRTYEGFSEDPRLTGRLGRAAVVGLQGQPLGGADGVLACAKHFVGDGGTEFGTAGKGKGLDQGDMRVDLPTLRRIHLAPYRPAIEAGVGSIMPSYSSWNGVKMSADKQLLTDVLKGELGFQGFLISDYNAIDQITPDYEEAIRISINAGMDMVMVPSNYRQFIKHLTDLVHEGKVSPARIDDAVTRILRVKEALGMLASDWQPAVDPQCVAEFGSAAHRAVARKAVSQSLVVLKNDHRVLPLRRSVGRVCIAGTKANDVGCQCGGWTIKWQGATGQVTTGGTTILEAMRAALGSDRVSYAADGRGAGAADVCIVVVGESPYAEMKGDREDLQIDADDAAVMDRVAQANVPIVVVLLTGRPLVITDVLPRVDGLVVGWLPGTEGGGVADVLVGDVPPSGKLSMSWPRSMAQIPINASDGGKQPLFPLGFGLTWSVDR